MLLALDVGNTNTKLGLYRLDGKEPALAAHWRLSSHRAQTVDEYGALCINLFAMKGLDPAEVKYIIISSVVPPVDSTLRQMCREYFEIDPLFVSTDMNTGMPLKVDYPAELGADRLAYSVAAFARYGGPCIVVEFGTATKFEVISERGEYLGGAIAPGLGLSAEALFSRAAKLSRVDITRPARVVGKNTSEHIQTGLYYGYIGLVDGILDRILNELGAEQGGKPHIVASGIMAHLIAPDSRYIKEAQIDDMLTLDGLRILFERNRDRAKKRGEAS